MAAPAKLAIVLRRLGKCGVQVETINKKGGGHSLTTAFFNYQLAHLGKG